MQQPAPAPWSPHKERELTQVLSLTILLDLALVFGPLVFQQPTGCIPSLASKDCWSPQTRWHVQMIYKRYYPVATNYAPDGVLRVFMEASARPVVIVCAAS